MNIGDTVYYKGAGKLARSEGTSGQWCEATVKKEVAADDEWVSVMPVHRTLENAKFKNLGASVPKSTLRTTRQL